MGFPFLWVADVLRVLLLLLSATALVACQTPGGVHQLYPPPPPPPVIQPLPPQPAPQPPRLIPLQPAPQPPQLIPMPLPAQPEPQSVPQPPQLVPAPPSGPRTAEDISSGAVSALMKQARAYLNANQPDRAAGVLERALRIEPRNYFVWSALGQAYLGQKNYVQAESVAAKSNALSHGNPYVALENWKTIAAACQASGNVAGAQDAQANIEAIQSQLGAAAGG